MTNFTYNQNVPNPPDNPSADVGDMQINSQSIAGILAVDHIGFNVDNGGWHTILHQPNQAKGGPTVGGQANWNPVSGSGIPALVQAAKILGVQQTFTLNYTPDFTGAFSDTQLFSMTGLGGISQLTGNFTTTEGWQWIGGTLIQWGRLVTALTGSFASGTATGTVTFKDRVFGAIPFPNNCFAVTTTPYWTVTPTGARNIVVSIQTPPSATSFNWSFNGSSGTASGFFWFAIGN